jgi:DHA1 family tetracycline resistance protein-like MFS transporter
MKIKFFLLTTVFIDIIGLGIIIPVLPFYVQGFGVSDSIVTILFAVYALLSFLSAPLLGSLSDKIGRRPVLLISIASSALGWLIFASAKSIWVLFIGRIIDGLAAGNITSVQSALADIAKSDKERTLNMGLFGALFGIGFIIGPALGGLLSKISTTTPFWFVGILALSNVIFAYFFFPETHAQKDITKKISYNPFTSIIDGFALPNMRKVFATWFIFGIALSLQQSSFSLYLARTFGISSFVIGIIFGGIGVLILLNQLILLKRLWLKIGSTQKISQLMFIVFGVGMFFQSIPLMAALIIGLIGTTIGQGTIRALYGGTIANASEEKRGEYLGISSSLMSLSMVIGPLLATFFITDNPSIPIIMSGILGIFAFLINFKWKKQKKSN